MARRFKNRVLIRLILALNLSPGLLPHAFGVELEFKPAVNCGKAAPSTAWLSSGECLAKAARNVGDPATLALEDALHDGQTASLYYLLKYRALTKAYQHYRFREAIDGRRENQVGAKAWACLAGMPGIRQNTEPPFKSTRETSLQHFLAGMPGARKTADTPSQVKVEAPLDQYIRRGDCVLEPEAAGNTGRGSCHSLPDLAYRAYFTRNSKTLPGILAQMDPALGLVAEAIGDLEYRRRLNGISENDPIFLGEVKRLYLAANEQLFAQIRTEMEKICEDNGSALILNHELNSEILLENPQLEGAYCRLYRETVSLMDLGKDIHHVARNVKTGVTIGGTLLGGAAFFVGGAAAWIPLAIALQAGAEVWENRIHGTIENQKSAMVNQGIAMRTDSQMLQREIQQELEGVDEELVTSLVGGTIGMGAFYGINMAYRLYQASKLSLPQFQAVSKVLARWKEGKETGTPVASSGKPPKQ